MTFNAFEGARRIAVLISAMVIVGTLWLTVQENPYVSTTYIVPTPTTEPFRVSRSCKSGEARGHIYREIESGRNISVELCFTPMDFGKAGMLVPYRTDEKGMLWGSSYYSKDVSEYVDSYEAKFQIPEQDMKILGEEWKKRRWDNIKDYVTYLVIGLASFWLAVWIVGWIVRGFFGIPRGADRKPSVE